MRQDRRSGQVAKSAEFRIWGGPLYNARVAAYSPPTVQTVESGHHWHVAGIELGAARRSRLSGGDARLRGPTITRIVLGPGPGFRGRECRLAAPKSPATGTSRMAEVRA